MVTTGRESMISRVAASLCLAAGRAPPPAPRRPCARAEGAR
jgi:hypothetical protein